MNQLLKKLPLPITGVILALATLGNLLGAYHPSLKTLCGIVAAVLWVLVTVKFIRYPQPLKEGLSHPVVGGVLCTYPMAAMVLSTYAKPYSIEGSILLWGGAVLLHLLQLGLFTKRFLVKMSLEKVFPTYFIVYVGFVVASVTAPAFGLQAVGRGLFWIGLVNLLWLLPIVVKRMASLGIKMDPAKPTTAIMTAPAALCLAGYLSSFETKSMAMVVALLGLSFVLYTFVLSQLPRLLKLPFMPSYSAFTFPLVISAVAFKGSAKFIMTATGAHTYLAVLANFAVLMATAVTFYVLGRFVVALAQTAPAAQPEKA